MLVYINTIDDPLLAHLKDDPVRPDIPAKFRVDTNRFVMALVEEQVRAVVCVSLQDSVPVGVEELGYAGDAVNTAIFYTVDAIRAQYPAIRRFVTLSPKTEMARKFHIKNGAVVYRENENTINYEYLIGQV